MSIEAAKIKIRFDKVEEFLVAARELATATRQEKDCAFYQIYRDKNNSLVFYFIEEWTQDGAMAEHFETLHCKKFGLLMQEIADGDVAPFEWERVV